MSALADIIATAIADGGSEVDAMPAAERVIAALKAVGPQFEDAMAVEPYVPAEYPKWVGHHVVENAEEEARMHANRTADPALTPTPVEPEPAVTPAPIVLHTPEPVEPAPIPVEPEPPTQPAPSVTPVPPA
jgi:hypothetical protein